jgi:hypothetical protein
MPRKWICCLAWTVRAGPSPAGRVHMQEVIPVQRRTPYSFVCVNAFSVAHLPPGRAGQTCWVGVDVAKRELIACVYWSDGTFERPRKVVAPDQIGVLVDEWHRDCPSFPPTDAWRRRRAGRLHQAGQALRERAMVAEDGFKAGPGIDAPPPRPTETAADGKQRLLTPLISCAAPVNKFAKY